MYACMRACVHVCMPVMHCNLMLCYAMYVCACMYVLYVCMHACMYVFMRVMYVMCVCMHAMYVCMYVCMYLCNACNI